MIGVVAIAGQSILVYSFKFPDGSFNLVRGYAVSGIIMGIFLLTPAIGLATLVKEPVPANHSKKRTSILKGFKLTLTNFPFMMVVLVSIMMIFFLSIKRNN